MLQCISTVFSLYNEQVVHHWLQKNSIRETISSTELVFKRQHKCDSNLVARQVTLTLWPDHGYKQV